MPESAKPSRLVHLNALRAFEAAARHQSFVAAADELSVTPSAISQHVKALEDYLGLSLFVRGKTGVTPTPAALDAYADIRDGLSQLARGFNRLRGADATRAVVLTVMPSLAAKWLLPRIERFQAAHPDIELRLDTTGRLVDFASEGVDLGIRLGLGGYPGLLCERWLEESLIPVCSPALLPKDRPMTPADLLKLPLIHDRTIDFDPSYPDWRTWFQARGLATPDSARDLRMNSSLLAIQAAIEGLGVLLARSALVQADLRAGRLAQPFAEAETTRCAYFVIMPPAAAERAAVKAVRDWLFEEALRAS
ncbi:transcriptional regulator GcvA [Lysobacter terrae]